MDLPRVGEEGGEREGCGGPGLEAASPRRGGARLRSQAKGEGDTRAGEPGTGVLEDHLRLPTQVGKEGEQI